MKLLLPLSKRPTLLWEDDPCNHFNVTGQIWKYLLTGLGQRTRLGARKRGGEYFSNFSGYCDGVESRTAVGEAESDELKGSWLPASSYIRIYMYVYRGQWLFLYTMQYLCMMYVCTYITDPSTDFKLNKAPVQSAFSSFFLKKGGVSALHGDFFFLEGWLRIIHTPPKRSFLFFIFILSYVYE